MRWIATLQIAFVFLLCGAGSRASGANPTRPNIVLLMVDDLDTGSLGQLLQAGFMPNLKTYVVDHGVTFRQFFATTPVCSPSRATLLSGRYAHNHRVARNEFPYGGVTLFDDTSTLATWLQSAGYLTAHIGKYLNGYGNSDINHDGVIDARDLTYIPPGWNYWYGLLEGYENRMYQYAANDNGHIVYRDTAASDYQTDVLSGVATRTRTPSRPPVTTSLSSFTSFPERLIRRCIRTCPILILGCLEVDHSSGAPAPRQRPPAAAATAVFQRGGYV